jgi:predicted N-formylglutamate amidohydrolase
MAEVPFLRVHPRSASPLVLTCEHASRSLPPGLEADPASRAILRTHWGSDLGAWRIAGAVARLLGAGAVGGRWSRLVIDLNRPVGDPTLIRTEAEGIVLPWNRRLPAREVERRIMEFHAPYHAEIDRLLVRRIVQGLRPVVVAVHTFTPRLGAQVRRFDAGVLYADHERHARRLARGLHEQGLSVRYNEPYSGLLGLMYAAERHGSHHRLPCLEVEINQARLATAAGARRIARALARALRRLLPAGRAAR